LNTVVPFGQDAYYKARPRIAVAQDQVLPLDGARGIGLHPQMTALKQMLDEGMASIVQGVGYPNPNRSHFASMDVWHTGDTRSNKGLGWLGKALDQVAAETPNSMVAIGDEAPLAGSGKLNRPVSFQNASLFRWQGSDIHEALEEPYQKINRALLGAEAAEGDDQAAFIRRTALNAQVASEQIRRAVAKGPETSFPDGKLANQLKMVAAMIRANLPTRVYYVGLGGFDTHANQVGRHQGILHQFAESVRNFYRELKAIGQDGRVLTLAFSEFGRRVAQNASGGTDHGVAGPMFLFGDMIRPGLLGTHPSFSRLDRGDLIHTVDFRSVYASVLDQWLKADSRNVLGRRFKPAAVLNRDKLT
ncbi:MAG: DUF1501 domain-containing protein, partial [Pirellulaceae bacterium]|nr:DUF1501 domain-containing protein [Pirellulaceae bacterium]